MSIPHRDLVYVQFMKWGGKGLNRVPDESGNSVEVLAIASGVVHPDGFGAGLGFGGTAGSEDAGETGPPGGVADGFPANFPPGSFKGLVDGVGVTAE